MNGVTQAILVETFKLLVVPAVLFVLAGARKAWRTTRRPADTAQRETSHMIANLDASTVVLARVNAELEQDLATERQGRREEARRYSEDRARWEQERRVLLEKAEADRREMRAEMDRLERRLREALQELAVLRSRYEPVDGGTE